MAHSIVTEHAGEKIRGLMKMTYIWIFCLLFLSWIFFLIFCSLVPFLEFGFGFIFSFFVRRNVHIFGCHFVDDFISFSASAFFVSLLIIIWYRCIIVIKYIIVSLNMFLQLVHVFITPFRRREYDGYDCEKQSFGFEHPRNCCEYFIHF
jgi:hypothetical protein